MFNTNKGVPDDLFPEKLLDWTNDKSLERAKINLAFQCFIIDFTDLKKRWTHAALWGRTASLNTNLSVFKPFRGVKKKNFYPLNEMFRFCNFWIKMCIFLNHHACPDVLRSPSAGKTRTLSVCLPVCLNDRQAWVPLSRPLLSNPHIWLVVLFFSWSLFPALTQITELEILLVFTGFTFF